MTNNVYNPGGYISDRYGQPKPRVTLDVAIEDQITLADIRHLIGKAANFADNAKIIVFKDVLRVVQEPTKPVTLHHRGGEHLQWTVGVDMEDGKGTPVTTKIEQQRDHLGRFTKRK